jgi:hypothetical protein
MTPWLKREATRVKEWRALDAIYSVGEFQLKLLGWDRARRSVVVREEIQERKPSRGPKLIEVAGYTFQIFVTSLPDAPEKIWRDYNQRACVEQRIEELKSDLAADDSCLREFLAAEAAFPYVLMLFNLLGEFQPAAGMTGYRQPATLRVQVFPCGAILGSAGRRQVSHLSAAWGGLEERTCSSTMSYFTRFQLRASWNSNHTRQGIPRPLNPLRRSKNVVQLTNSGLLVG